MDGAEGLIDGLFSLAYGLYTHFSPIPPVTGGAELAKFLTQDLEGLTSGKVALADDPVEAAKELKNILIKTG